MPSRSSTTKLFLLPLEKATLSTPTVGLRSCCNRHSHCRGTTEGCRSIPFGYNSPAWMGYLTWKYRPFMNTHVIDHTFVDSGVCISVREREPHRRPPDIIRQYAPKDNLKRNNTESNIRHAHLDVPKAYHQSTGGCGDSLFFPDSDIAEIPQQIYSR